MTELSPADSSLRPDCASASAASRPETLLVLEFAHIALDSSFFRKLSQRSVFSTGKCTCACHVVFSSSLLIVLSIIISIVIIIIIIIITVLNNYCCYIVLFNMIPGCFYSGIVMKDK